MSFLFTFQFAKLIVPYPAPLPSPLRFAASATGGAHLRGTQDPHQLPHGVRVSQIPSKQRKGTRLGALSSFGALPDEGVKNNMPVAYCLA